MGWKSEIIYPSLHCHHQNDSCIKMGSDEINFKVSLIVRDKVSLTAGPNRLTRREKDSRVNFLC